MIITIVGYSLEFFIEATLLFAALWIMIRIQNLNYNFLGLAGTAALTTVVEMGVEHFVGTYVSTGVVVGVLSFCIWKVTQAEQVDVAFTVMVGTALVFIMELFLLGALMGDLRPSAEDEEMTDLVELAEEMEHRPISDFQDESEVETELPVAANSSPVPVTTNSPSPTLSPTPATSGLIAVAAVTDSAPDYALSFTLKGVTKSKKNSIALVHSGVNAYTISSGESVSMQTTSGRVLVRCAGMETNSVTLEIAGRQIFLSLE